MAVTFLSDSLTGGGTSGGSLALKILDLAGWTGGGATNLDGQATSGYTLPALVPVRVSGVVRLMRLDTGSGANNAPTKVVPLDNGALRWTAEI